MCTGDVYYVQHMKWMKYEWMSEERQHKERDGEQTSELWAKLKVIVHLFAEMNNI